MGLTRLSVDRPIVILMAIAALLLLGVYGYRRMPADLDPKVQVAVIHVMTIYPGASPKQVEDRVTRPLEDAVASINGVRSIDSTSLEHVANLTVRFQEGTDANVAAAEVRSRVEAARGKIPPEAADPVVSKVDLNSQPVMVLGATLARRPDGLSDDQALHRLRQAVEDDLKPRLSRVPGVASVRLLGGREREIQVRADPARLLQYGLAITDLLSPIRAASVDVPFGELVDPARQEQTKGTFSGEFTRLAQIERVPLYPGGASGGMAVSAAARAMEGARGPGGMGAAPSLPAPVLVSDVAEVVDTYEQPEEIVRVGGQEAVLVTVTRLADANTVEVADRVQAQIRELEKQQAAENRPGRTGVTPLKVAVLQDQSTGVRLALEDITLALVLGSLLAVLVVFVFLHNVRDTIIIAIAIPTSIIATFAVIWLFGFTLNQMTMLALSLSVGILVDDSILVLDSIHRHRSMGKPPREAALDGRQEIGLADATNTLVDVVVFVPVALMGGLIGMYFKQFGLTIATATLFSMYVSFSLTPMLAARWAHRAPRRGENAEGGKSGFPAWFDRHYANLEEQYRKVLVWGLRRRLLVVALGFGALAVSVSIAMTRMGRELLPTIDRGEIQVTLESNAGKRLVDTAEAMRQIETVIANSSLSRDIELDRMFAHIGEIGGGAERLPEHGPTFADLKLHLKQKASFSDWVTQPFARAERRTRSDEEIARQLREELAAARIEGARRIEVSAVRTISRSRAPISISLYAHEGHEAGIERAAERVRSELDALKGPDGTPLLINVDTTNRAGLPELRVEPNRERIAEYQVTPAEVGQATRVALDGDTNARFRAGEYTYPVRVQVDPARLRTTADLKDLIVSHRGGTPVYLDEVADVRRSAGAARILRRDRRPMARVNAELAPGVDLGTAQAAAKARIEALRDRNHPDLAGMADYKMGGESEGMGEAMREVSWALIFAIALSYMLMAALFNSFLYPLTIIMSVPMALVGAILALWATDTPLSVVAMIGIVMLVGLVSKNAILLVDFTNTLRHRDGYDRDAAILAAGPVRLRPILMTTIATILGMLPVALRIGQAAEMRAPMAIAVIGGLILSTLLTLLVIPCVYTYFDDFTRLIQRAWARRFSPTLPPSTNGHDRNGLGQPEMEPHPEMEPRPEPRVPAGSGGEAR